MVERAANQCDTFTTFDNAASAGATSFVDTQLAFDTANCYRVYAFNASGPSAATIPAEVDVQPLAPSGLTGLYNSGVFLTFFDNSLVETGFSLQRCSGAGCTNFAEIVALLANTAGTGVGNVSYLDTGVLPNTTYRYRVITLNSNAADALAIPSDPSNIFTFTTPNVPITPGPVSVTCRRQGGQARCDLARESAVDRIRKA